MVKTIIALASVLCVGLIAILIIESNINKQSGPKKHTITLSPPDIDPIKADIPIPENYVQTIANSLSQDELWILVETKLLSLTILKGIAPVEQFKNVSIGRNGAGKKQLGDDKTPLGKFRIGWINEKSRYHRFFGLNYPNLDNAGRALKSGLIDSDTYHKLRHSNLAGEIPLQYTALGGLIGIHGLGQANQTIHARVNWTHGCIAITNEQIDFLNRWVKTGTLVVVR